MAITVIMAIIIHASNIRMVWGDNICWWDGGGIVVDFCVVEGWAEGEEEICAEPFKDGAEGKENPHKKLFEKSTKKKEGEKWMKK